MYRFGSMMHGLTGRLPGPAQAVWDGFQGNVDKGWADAFTHMQRFGDSVGDNIKAAGGQAGDSWGLIRNGVDGGINNGRKVGADMLPIGDGPSAANLLGSAALNSDNNGREPWRQQPWGQGQGGFGDARFGGPGGDHRWGPGGRWAPENQGQWGQQGQFGQQGGWNQPQGQWGQPQGQWGQPQGQWGAPQGRNQWNQPQNGNQNPFAPGQNQWSNQQRPSQAPAGGLSNNVDGKVAISL